jgi:hypothetical protein
MVKQAKSVKSETVTVGLKTFHQKNRWISKEYHLPVEAMMEECPIEYSRIFADVDDVSDEVVAMFSNVRTVDAFNQPCSKDSYRALYDFSACPELEDIREIIGEAMVELQEGKWVDRAILDMTRKEFKEDYVEYSEGEWKVKDLAQSHSCEEWLDEEAASYSDFRDSVSQNFSFTDFFDCVLTALVCLIPAWMTQELQKKEADIEDVRDTKKEAEAIAWYLARDVKPSPIISEKGWAYIEENVAPEFALQVKAEKALVRK